MRADFLSHPHVNNTFKVGMYTSKPGYKTNLNGRAMTNVDDEGRIFLSHPHVNNTFKVGTCMYTSKPGYKANLNGRAMTNVDDEGGFSIPSSRK